VAHLLTVDLDTLTPAKAELLAGFIMTFADGKASGFTEDAPHDLIKNHAIDPAAAFGAPIPTGPISEAGPSLVIPADPIPAGNAVQTSVPPATSTPSVSTAGVTLDKEGLPWDARIHASSRTQNADGTWRLKRGLQKDHLDKVTAELRQVMAIPSPAPGPQLVPPPPAAIAHAPQSAVPAPPPPVADEVSMRQKYIDLFGRISAAMSAGKLTQAQLDTCLQSISVPSLPLLGARLDLVPQACALIDGVIAGASA
jgi:hypothetical protein